MTKDAKTVLWYEVISLMLAEAPEFESIADDFIKSDRKAIQEDLEAAFDDIDFDGYAEALNADADALRKELRAWLDSVP